MILVSIFVLSVGSTPGEWAKEPYPIGWVKAVKLQIRQIYGQVLSVVVQIRNQGDVDCFWATAKHFCHCLFGNGLQCFDPLIGNLIGT